MLAKPAISVVIPSYNSARFLPNAVRSALAQTRPASEIIVVDDGSTDETPDILGPFRESIEVIRLPENRGLPAARNAGIRASRGDIVGFLDADDVWKPTMIERQTREFAATPQPGLCFTGLIDCNERMEPMKRARAYRRRVCEDVFVELYLKAFPMPPSTVFVRRSVFEKVGLFDESMLKKQDFECWLRIAMQFRVSCIAEALCLRRVHPGALTLKGSAERNLFFENRAFELCGEAAARVGRELPMPVKDRKIVGHRRRLRQMLSYGDLDAARVYRNALKESGDLGVGDRMRELAFVSVAVIRRGLRRMRMS